MKEDSKVGTILEIPDKHGNIQKFEILSIEGTVVTLKILKD